MRGIPAKPLGLPLEIGFIEAESLDELPCGRLIVVVEEPGLEGAQILRTVDGEASPALTLGVCRPALRLQSQVFLFVDLGVTDAVNRPKPFIFHRHPSLCGTEERFLNPPSHPDHPNRNEDGSKPEIFERAFVFIP